LAFEFNAEHGTQPPVNASIRDALRRTLSIAVPASTIDDPRIPSSNFIGAFR